MSTTASGTEFERWLSRQIRDCETKLGRVPRGFWRTPPVLEVRAREAQLAEAMVVLLEFKRGMGQRPM